MPATWGRACRERARPAALVCSGAFFEKAGIFTAHLTNASDRESQQGPPLRSARTSATALVFFASLFASTCRPISFCRSDGKDCASAEARAHPDQGDAGEGGAAGADGQAPWIPEIDCEFPLANCDESTLTGCETDLLESPVHCGGCETPAPASAEMAAASRSRRSRPAWSRRRQVSPWRPNMCTS